jgi:hypothetical protein
MRYSVRLFGCERIEIIGSARHGLRLPDDGTNDTAFMSIVR